MVKISNCYTDETEELDRLGLVHGAHKVQKDNERENVKDRSNEGRNSNRNKRINIQVKTETE